jgi:hypothetical protein
MYVYLAIHTVLGLGLLVGYIAMIPDGATKNMTTKQAAKTTFVFFLCGPIGWLIISVMALLYVSLKLIKWSTI